MHIFLPYVSIVYTIKKYTPMPQLDKVTFLSQFFWLCFFYIGFYYILVKVYLPKLSRILALRKKKLTGSTQDIHEVHLEQRHVRTHSDGLVSKAFSTSKNTLENSFSHTLNWVHQTVQSVNKTHYQPMNTSYMEFLGETSLSQNILLYHASKNIPKKLALKFLLDKMKNLKNASSESLKKN